LTIGAYVLIETIAGKTREVAHSIHQVEHVKAVDIVAGPVDIIIKLKAADMTAVGEIVSMRFMPFLASTEGSPAWWSRELFECIRSLNPFCSVLSKLRFASMPNRTWVDIGI